jgi:hypothetical protein
MSIEDIESSTSGTYVSQPEVTKPEADKPSAIKKRDIRESTISGKFTIPNIQAIQKSC